MKKLVLVVCMCAFILGTTVMAAASPLADYSTPGNTNIGVRFQTGLGLDFTRVMGENWGVGVHYNYYDYSGYSAVHSISLLGKYMWFRDNRLTVVPYAGINYWTWEVEYRDWDGSRRRIDENFTSFVYGAEFIFEINERFKAFVDVGGFSSGVASFGWSSGLSYAVNPNWDVSLYFGGRHETGAGIGVTYRFSRTQ